MEVLHKSLFWIATIFMATIAICVGAGIDKRPFVPSDSIMDIINTEQVEKLIAQREAEAAATSSAFTQKHELGDEGSKPMVISIPDNDSTEFIPTIDFRKALKSSKNALFVTKKEYLKDEWCKAKPLVQKIREPGCVATTFINKFCYGQCNSFYIPRGARRRETNEDRPAPAFKSCSSCRPKKMSWVTVKLHCPSLNPPYKFKRLQKIKQCKCLSVGVN